jgi:hypothetical protein
MGTAMESYGNFLFGNGDVRWHVDEIAEDLPCLGVFVAAHAPRNLSGGQMLEVEGAQGLVLALAGRRGLGEEPLAIR